MRKSPPAGKGYTHRPYDREKFDSEFDRIFGKKEAGNARKESKDAEDDDKANDEQSGDAGALRPSDRA